MIAKQHNCPLIDMIPKEHPTSPTVHVNVCFDPHLSEFLFLSSWKDFDMLCSDIKVQSVRHQIGSILKKVASNDLALSYDDENALHNLFISLDTVLREYYLPILNQLVENMSTSIFNPEAASSDYFRTEKLAFGTGDYGRFIGEGCFLNDSFTDKLSLYLRNESHGITIFDLCFGEHLDEGNCNTISLANIENF